MFVSVSQSSISAKIRTTTTEKVQRTSFSSGTDASSIITMSQSMSGTVDSPQSSGSVLIVAVAAGVSAAVVLKVLTFLVVALVVCICFQRGKKKREEEISNQPSDIHDNVAYGINYHHSMS